MEHSRSAEIRGASSNRSSSEKLNGSLEPVNRSRTNSHASRHSSKGGSKRNSLEARVTIEKNMTHSHSIIDGDLHKKEEEDPNFQIGTDALTSDANLQEVFKFELEEYDPESQDKCIKGIQTVQTSVHGFFRNHGPVLKKIVLVILLILYTIYFGYAIYHSVSEALVLIVMTGLIVGYLLWSEIWKHWGSNIRSVTCDPVSRCFSKPWWKYGRCGIYIGLGIAVIVFLAVDVGSDYKRLTSAAGMAIIILLSWLTSTNPARVDWRPVIWGIGLQFLLGVIILRWEPGYYFFRFLGEQVKVFLDYTDEGSKFVFGEETYMDHPMAFKVFPIVIYFSAVISIFYYWGLMQFIVCKIAYCMQFTMGTTAIESLNAACNIFIGMAESCVILRPFVHKLTKSELHAVMTGGFATVAGSYIALLVEVGASPEHLLSAAIMSAPAALGIAKLSYPETEVSHTKTEDDVYMEKTPARNVVEAASNGAIDAIKVVASVAANLIAILGLIAFLNATLSYIGHRVGYSELNFQKICSFVFWPLAAIMGVDLEDAGKVASLLGTKVFVDEFISFRDLGQFKATGAIGDRSIVIATYACCGFGSIAAVGVYIGALVSVAPLRRGDISEVALRAVVNGNLAGFLTACIAGVLYTGESMMFQSHDIVPSNITELIATVMP
jgi:pyrimidine nucleoside transport protein